MTSAGYLSSYAAFQRRKTRVVSIGKVTVGGREPIRVQSMTTTPTYDVQATTDQIEALVKVGCEIVRLTVPSKRDALALPLIRQAMQERALDVPLVADIHFAPALAMFCVDHVEKVRINPGNFVDSKKFAVREYSDEEYQAELDRIEEAFTPLVLKMKAQKVAMRIGTNHGSLSDRILNRYGDTPQGMVESALEFVRICRKHDYHEIIMSMKASNPIVMIQAYRLLAARMDEEGMDYPFHLGVTEAGDGLDARVKSAVGMGSLMLDGIGDTVRVSLTENPCAEVPVGFDLVSLVADKSDDTAAQVELPHDPYLFLRRESRLVDFGGMAYGRGGVPRVETHFGTRYREAGFQIPRADTGDGVEFVTCSIERDSDFAFLAAISSQCKELEAGLGLALRGALLTDDNVQRILNRADRLEIALGDVPLAKVESWLEAAKALDKGFLLQIKAEDAALVLELESKGFSNFALCMTMTNLFDEGLHQARKSLAVLAKSQAPLVLDWQVAGLDPVLAPSSLLGALLADGYGDALRVPARQAYDGVDPVNVAYTILQATRYRTVRTEYVSCPSCGRTLFDLEETTARIKALTGHLPNVKIAIMGCIVNGPGEMADADFGYVGWKPGKVDLWVGKEVVEKAIPESEAPYRLVDLLKKHGVWMEPKEIAAV